MKFERGSLKIAQVNGAMRDGEELSTQVVQEFYVAASRKPVLPRRKVQDAVAALLDLPVITIGPTQILSAISKEGSYKISF